MPPGAPIGGRYERQRPPVHIGNAAFLQFAADVAGDPLDVLHDPVRMGENPIVDSLVNEAPEAAGRFVFHEKGVVNVAVSVGAAADEPAGQAERGPHGDEFNVARGGHGGT